MHVPGAEIYKYGVIIRGDTPGAVVGIVGAALDLLEQGEAIERIMLRVCWQTGSTIISYLRNYFV